jgi:hypothetical protein
VDKRAQKRARSRLENHSVFAAMAVAVTLNGVEGTVWTGTFSDVFAVMAMSSRRSVAVSSPESIDSSL